jgi:hypothetical protein
MKSDIFERIRKRTKLSNKLKVLNEMAFIDLLTILGYREEKMWTPDEDEKLQKLMDYAKKHTARQMEEIKEHLLENKKIE